MLSKGFYNMDCMDAMREFPDSFFDFAVVDPPYGNGTGDDETKLCNAGSRFERYRQQCAVRTGGGFAAKYGKNIVEWDVAPGKGYFDELFRISKKQIIWGGNYFGLPANRNFIVWHKLTISEGFTMAMCEYAWCSFGGNAKLFACAPQGSKAETRFHPTQKPVKLYEWIARMYLQPGMKVLDTHVGSASSLIAYERAGIDYWGFEINEAYYRAASERLEKQRCQIKLELPEENTAAQVSLF